MYYCKQSRNLCLLDIVIKHTHDRQCSMWRRAELERSQAVKIKVTKSYKLVLAFNDRPITTTIAYSTALINYSCRAERHSKYSASTSTYKMSLHFARDMIEMRCLVKRNFRCTANKSLF